MNAHMQYAPTLYCAVPYIAACVDVSRMVFRDHSNWALRGHYGQNRFGIQDMSWLLHHKIMRMVRSFK